MGYIGKKQGVGRRTRAGEQCRIACRRGFPAATERARRVEFRANEGRLFPFSSFLIDGEGREKRGVGVYFWVGKKEYMLRQKSETKKREGKRRAEAHEGTRLRSVASHPPSYLSYLSIWQA